MILHVLFYKFTDNPLRLPDDWPAEVREVRDGTRPPPNWVEMSEEEYAQHRARLAPQVSISNDAAAEAKAREEKFAVAVKDAEEIERGGGSVEDRLARLEKVSAVLLKFIETR